MAAIGVGGRGTGVGHQAGSLGSMVACADVNRRNAEKFAEKYGLRFPLLSDPDHRVVAAALNGLQG